MAAERFLPRLAWASAPLWAWALHFFLSYVLVAIGCDAGPGGARRLDPATLRALAVGAGLVAWLAIAACARGACRVRARHAPGRLLDAALALAALLAAIGIGWTLLPLLLLPPCAPA
jgi:hypothetical protein